MGSVASTTTWKGASPRFRARVAGWTYVGTFLAGGSSLVLRGGPGLVTGLLAGLTYVVVTFLFYGLFRPVHRGISLLAAALSLGGVVLGPLRLLHLVPFHLNALVLFGLYCLLIGYLILRSTFLPRALGGLMVVAGLGWLTFLRPTFAERLFPCNLAPGLLGEGALTLWLVVKGVNERRWREQEMSRNPAGPVPSAHP